MLIQQINPTQIVLEVKASNPDGSQKTNIVTATVRVYHVTGGVEVNDLAPISMTQVGSTNSWQYVWTPSSLSVNNYIAEYTMVDSNALIATVGENIMIGYLETELDLVNTNVQTILNIETGRWRILNNQLLLYGPDNSTLIATFNLFDSTGTPTSDSPVDRQKV